MFIPFIAILFIVYNIYTIYLYQIKEEYIENDCNGQFKKQANEYQSIVGISPKDDCYPMISETHRIMFEDSNPSRYTDRWGAHPDYC